MDARRKQLVRLLNRRRRRIRLMLVCLATALACGLVAGIVGPQILIGGVSYDAAVSAASKSRSRERTGQAAGKRHHGAFDRGEHLAAVASHAAGGLIPFISSIFSWRNRIASGVGSPAILTDTAKARIKADIPAILTTSAP